MEVAATTLDSNITKLVTELAEFNNANIVKITNKTKLTSEQNTELITEHAVIRKTYNNAKRLYTQLYNELIKKDALSEIVVEALDPYKNKWQEIDDIIEDINKLVYYNDPTTAQEMSNVQLAKKWIELYNELLPMVTAVTGMGTNMSNDVNKIMEGLDTEEYKSLLSKITRIDKWKQLQNQYLALMPKLTQPLTTEAKPNLDKVKQIYDSAEKYRSVIRYKMEKMELPLNAEKHRVRNRKLYDELYTANAAQQRKLYTDFINKIKPSYDQFITRWAELLVAREQVPSKKAQLQSMITKYGGLSAIEERREILQTNITQYQNEAPFIKKQRKTSNDINVAELTVLDYIISAINADIELKTKLVSKEAYGRDLNALIAGTDLTAISNRLIDDLCRQLGLDDNDLLKPEYSDDEYNKLNESLLEMQKQMAREKENKTKQDILGKRAAEKTRRNTKTIEKTDNGYVVIGSDEKPVTYKVINKQCEPDGNTCTVTVVKSNPNLVEPEEQSPIDNKYAKYNRMLKMLPKAAVENAMTRDGITPEQITAFFDSRPKQGGTKKRNRRTKRRRQTKRVRFLV